LRFHKIILKFFWKNKWVVTSQNTLQKRMKEKDLFYQVLKLVIPHTDTVTVTKHMPGYKITQWKDGILNQWGKLRLVK
jgi:hypothetical protein